MKIQKDHPLKHKTQHFGPAQVILFDFWPYLMQNALRNTFLTIKFDIHYSKVCYCLIQKVLDISCSPFCVPVGWLGRDQTFTLFTISSIFGSETSLVKKLDRLILDILRYVCSFRFLQLIYKPVFLEIFEKMVPILKYRRSFC